MSATTHPVAPEEVMALLDGELTGDRTALVSTHVKECSECRQAVDALSRTSGSLAKWVVPSLPVVLGERFLNGARGIKNLGVYGFILEFRGLLHRRWHLVWGSVVLGALLIFFTVNFAPRQAVKSVKEVQSAADSNGLYHGLGDHAQKSISVDDQSKIFNGPMIARTASLSLFVKDFDAGRASLDAILARHQGYAASLSVSTPEGAGRMIQASLRIPAPDLPAALGELKSLGRVEGENQTGEEISQQHADLVARIKNDQETEIRLKDILRTRTGKVKDILEVEQEVARVRGEIEQMQAEQKTLEHRVAFAKIELKLAEEYKAQLSLPAPSVASQIRNACVNGFRSAWESLLGIILFCAEAGPTLILWAAILFLPVRLFWRRYQKAHATLA